MVPFSWSGRTSQPCCPVKLSVLTAIVHIERCLFMLPVPVSLAISVLPDPEPRPNHAPCSTLAAAVLSRPSLLAPASGFIVGCNGLAGWSLCICQTSPGSLGSSIWFCLLPPSVRRRLLCFSRSGLVHREGVLGPDDEGGPISTDTGKRPPTVWSSNEDMQNVNSTIR